MSWCLPAEMRPARCTLISRLWVPYQSRTRRKLWPQKQQVSLSYPDEANPWSRLATWKSLQCCTNQDRGWGQHVPLKHATCLPNYTALHPSASFVNELCLPVPIQTDRHSLIHSAASLRCHCPNAVSGMHTLFCRGVKSIQTLMKRNKSKIQAMHIKYLKGLWEK
jgi:hypothetical protein